MAYANAHRPPDARALAGAAALQIAIGALVIAGLSNGELPFVQPPKPNPTATFYEVPKPPPPPVPTSEPAASTPKKSDTAVYRPDTIPDYFTGTPTIPTTGTVPDYGDLLDIPGPATAGTPGTGTTPSPSPSFKPIGPAPKSAPTSWFSTADYPTTAIRRELEGTVGYRLQVSATGKVESCTVTRSSGHSSLDRATCQLLPRRGKFTPARGADGKNVRGTFDAEIVWRLP